MKISKLVLTSLIGLFLKLRPTIFIYQFLWGCVHVSRTFLSFNNDKPWFTGKLKQLHQAKEDAYRSGDQILYNQARNRLTMEIRMAKTNYSEKLKTRTFSQRSGVSMDWSEEHHQVQDTSHTVCGESTTDWWSQCVLLPIWNGQTDTQQPLWSALHTFTPHYKNNWYDVYMFW